MIPYQIAVEENLGRKAFYRNYVDKGRPVLIKGMMEKWRALEKWRLPYFRDLDKTLKVPVKTANIADGKKEMILLSEYVRQLQGFEDSIGQGTRGVKPPYLHDVPIFALLPGLIKDLEPFPTELFPAFYRERWYDYVQFFMGSTGSVTPLHFDTLCTHNLFFQVSGRKKFILIPAQQREQCYLEGWRWFRFDPNSPDYNSFPKAKDISICTVELGPGDVLYIPPGTLHQVHGLSASISFNIDWHTPKSSLYGCFTYFRGAPSKNLYYNFLILLGLSVKFPPRTIFRYYKSYLNYVS